MKYVLLATHSAQECPSANRNVRDMWASAGKEVPQLAQKLGVKILIGPLVSAEHISVIVLETEKAEAVWDLVTQSGLLQWNSVHVIPCKTMEEMTPEIMKMKTLY